MHSTNWVALGLMGATKGIWRLLATGALTNGWRFCRVEKLP